MSLTHTKKNIIISISKKESGHTDVTTDLAWFSEISPYVKAKPSFAPLQASFPPPQKTRKQTSCLE